MNEDFKKSLFLNSSAVILSMGLIAPLCVGGSLRTNALLGILAMVLLTISNAILITLRPAIPKNGRIGIAVLVAGGLIALAWTALPISPLTANLPVETLFPIMLIVAALASLTDAHEVKKKWSLALFDGATIGLSFLLLLCLSAILRDGIGNDIFNNMKVIQRFQPLQIVVLLPGVLLIASLIAVLLPKKSGVHHD